MYSDTALTDIEDTLKKFIKRDDIDIILINQNVSITINKTRYASFKIDYYTREQGGNYSLKVLLWDFTRPHLDATLIGLGIHSYYIRTGETVYMATGQ